VSALERQAETQAYPHITSRSQRLDDIQEL